MSVILHDKESGEALAVLDNVIVQNSLIVSAVLNGEYVVRFEAMDPLDDPQTGEKLRYLQQRVYIEVDGQYFDVVYVEQTHGDTIRYRVECEHVSYRLRDKTLEDISYYNTPDRTLAMMLEGTEFLVGELDFNEVYDYQDLEVKSVFQALREYAGLVGARLAYNGFEIGLRENPARDNGYTACFGKNIRSLTKIIDRRNKSLYYRLDMLDLRRSPLYQFAADLERVSEGDLIGITDEAADTDAVYCVIGRSYRPDGETLELEIANRMELVSESIRQASTKTARKQYVYDHKPDLSEARAIPAGTVLHVYDRQSYDAGLYELPNLYYKGKNMPDKVYTNLLGVANVSWEAKSPPTEPGFFTNGLTMQIIGKKLYSTWGCVYDIGAKTWSRWEIPASGIRQSGDAFPFYSTLHGTAVVGDVLHYFESIDYNESREHEALPHFAFDSQTGTWSEKTWLSSGIRCAAQAVAVGTTIHTMSDVFFDGMNEGFNARIHAAYDTLSDTWSLKRANPLSLIYTAFAALGTTVYSLGGIVYGSQSTTGENLAYDTVTDTWSFKAPLPLQRSHFSAAAMDGFLHVIGGYMDERFTLYRTYEVYDPLTDSWSAREKMINVWQAIACAASEGVVYALGLAYSGGSAKAAFEEYRQRYDYDVHVTAGYSVIPDVDCYLTPSLQTLPAGKESVVLESGRLTSRFPRVSANINWGLPLHERKGLMTWRCGTIELWKSENPVLRFGEGAVVLDNTVVGLKIGNGKTRFNNLSYATYTLDLNNRAINPQNRPAVSVDIPGTITVDGFPASLPLMAAGPQTARAEAGNALVFMGEPTAAELEGLPDGTVFHWLPTDGSSALPAGVRRLETGYKAP